MNIYTHTTHARTQLQFTLNTVNLSDKINVW